jgi:beta-N-acetylglucosaminidase
MRKILSLLLSTVLFVSLVSVPSAHADDITGIKLETEMRAMVEANVIYGYGPGKYAPNANVSRGEFANFVARALKLPEGPHKFTDVAITSKLAPGINASVQAGIISGLSSGKFGPDDPVTREQMAIMIDKALDYLQVTKEKGTLNFTDLAEMPSSVSRLAVANMVGLEIILGIPNPDGTFKFAPKKTATRAEAAAFIYRMLKAAEQKEEETDPSDGENTFRVSTIGSDGQLIIGTKKYNTFAEANSAITNAQTQVITYNDKIVKMGSGIVVSKPPVGSNTTNIYNSSLSSTITYVFKDTELEYVSSDDTKIQVKIAGKTGYVKHTDAILLPAAMMTGRSYYSVNGNGDLVHNLYQNNSKTYAAYIFGKAPSFMKPGVKYYSWNGSTFVTESGAAAGTAYQYFNMLPARTKTNYTAEELNQVIDQKLAEKEALYKSNPTTYVRYKDATKISKIKGIGEDLKKIESTYKINALLVLSMAIHESDYGISANALTKNNLFGIKVYDNDPSKGEVFNTVYDCLVALATQYLNKTYIPVSGWAANGAMLGNKARGFNVRYASDAYWGQKIAGHMYQLDKALGGKDFLNNPNPYKIGETTANDLNIRHSAEVKSDNLQYVYKVPGYPVAILATENTNWYKILSDSNEYPYAYVYKSYVNELPIAK